MDREEIGRLFKVATNHYVTLTRILDKLQSAVPFKDKEAIQIALSMSHSNFQRWAKEYRLLSGPILGRQKEQHDSLPQNKQPL